MNAVAHIEPELVEAYHPIFDSPAWLQVCAERKPVQLTLEEQARAESLPDFDDPLFEFKLHYHEVPMEERKALFARLWETFDNRTQRDFAERICRGCR